VDFARRTDLLAALDSGPSAAVGLDAEKLLVTSRALRLRRDHPDWFAGRYEPLAAEGPAAGYALTFARGGAAVTVATRLPATLRRRGGWASTSLSLPSGPAAWRDVLTGVIHDGTRLALAQVTCQLPVALLIPS
jgi:(1->4)-alpha-D-glucan 1-alpha-D-glucosylmutase